MHVNFGLVPPLETRIRNKRERAAAYADRALQDLTTYLKGRPDLFGEVDVETLPH
jgi:methylenetetrahydrofolate--tRNA-(uracil-5-)-methyltransferase